MYKFLFVFLINFTLNLSLFSQAGFEIFYASGKIIPHHPELKYISDKRINSFTFTYNFSEKNKNTELNSILGIQTGIYDFRNPEILGKSICLAPTVRKTFKEFNRFNISYKFTAGLAYMTKTFDKNTNVYNTFVSSKISYYFQIFLSFNYKLKNKIAVSPEFGIVHFSNGAIKNPNLGMNIINAGISISYNSIIPKKTSNENSFNKEIQYIFILSGAGKSQYQPLEKKYFAGSFSNDILFAKKSVRAFGFGIDLFYDSSVADFTVLDSVYQSKKKDAVYPGFHLTYSREFSRISFIFQCGTYIYYRPFTYKYVFNRLGIRYKLNKHFMANISLKTYFAVADFVEFGIAYYFRKGF